MKRILLPLAAIAISLAACDTTPKYTIAGTVEGEQTGKVLLLKFEGRTADTLAQAEITEGKFTMTGTVDSLTEAFVVVEGKRGGTPIFVENVNFTATLNPASPTDNKIEGSETQNLANQFFAISNETRKGQMELSKEYSAAAQAKDTAKMRDVEARYEELSKTASEKSDALAKANADTYVAAYMLASQMGGLDLDALTEKYNALGEKAKASVHGKNIADRITKLNAVAIGQVAPDFTLNTPAGEALSMQSIKGKVKLIDFWASWCGPCRGENPNVVKMYEEFHPKGLEILGVSLDNNQEAWVKAIEDDKLTWMHVSDLKGWGSEAAQLYAVSGIPHTVLLDENNVIVAKDLRGDALKAKIAEMLK